MYLPPSSQVRVRLRRCFWLPCLILVWVLSGQVMAFPFSGGKIALAPEMESFITDQEIPIEDLIHGNYDARFGSRTALYLAQDKINWFRFSITDTTQYHNHWYLELETAMLGQADFYIVDNQQHITSHLRGGMSYPKAERPLPYNYLLFPIDQPANTTQTYYLRIRTPFQIFFSPILTDQAAFIRTAGINYSFPHLFIGLLMGVFVYLVVLTFTAAKERKVTRFVWFVFFAMLIMIYVDGFLFSYLPDNSWLTPRLWVLIHIGLQASYLLATEEYFSTPQRFPRINFILKSFLWTSLSFIPLTFILPYHNMVSLELFFAGMLVISMTGISFYIWIKDGRRVQLFVLGNVGLLFFAGLSTFTAISSLAASDWFVQHGYELGFCWQAIFFTWALSQQINSFATSAAVAHAENKAKSDFIAKMSHEIRTPMNGVLGMVQLLHSTSMNDEQKHYLNVIDSSGKTLLAIINDILDYSKLSAGKVDLSPHPFNLEHLLAEFNTLYGDIAHQKGLSFNIILDPGVPVHLNGDSIRLRQILTNLLTNAVKFTEHGIIVLKVKPDSTAAAPASQTHTYIKFSITDTGIGISEEGQKKLFQNFSQISSTTHRYSGTGLGLSISKQLVEILGGTINVSSRLGEGTEFSFILPMQLSSNHQTTAHTLDTPDEYVKNTRRILVAEDDDANRKVIAGFLGKLNLDFDLVSNGIEAVQAIRGNRSRYTAILMDCEMPLLNGLDACQKIREYEQLNKLDAMPIYGLSAHDSERYRKQCQDAGMNGHLAKPLSLQQLKNTFSP